MQNESDGSIQHLYTPSSLLKSKSFLTNHLRNGKSTIDDRTVSLQWNINIKTFPISNISLLQTTQDSKFMLHYSKAKSIIATTLISERITLNKNELLCTKSLLETTKHLCSLKKTLDLTYISLNTFVGDACLKNKSKLKEEFLVCIPNIIRMVTTSFDHLLVISQQAISCFTNVLYMLSIMPLQFSCKIRKSQSLQACSHYCSHILSQCNAVIECLIILQLDTLQHQLKVDKTEKILLTPLIYLCHSLSKNIKNLSSTVINTSKHCSILKKSTKKPRVKLERHFVFVWSNELKQLSRDKNKFENNLMEYVTRASKWRVVYLSETLTRVSFSDVKLQASSMNGDTDSQCSESSNSSASKNGFVYYTKEYMKVITNNHCKQYKKILNKEMSVLANFLDGIISMNTMILRQNNDALNSKDTPQLISKTQHRHVKLINWDTNIGPVQRDQLFECYMQTLWMGLKKHVKSSYLSHLLCLNNEKMMRLSDYSLSKADGHVFLNSINKLNSSKKLPHQLLEVLSNLIFSIKTMHSLQEFDKNLSKAMVVLLKDRFRYIETTEPGNPCSPTFNQILYSLVPITDLLNSLKKNENLVKQHSIIQVKDIQNFIINPLETSYSFLNYCLLSKRQQTLLSASWQAFFVIISLDAPKVFYYTEFLLNSLHNVVDSALNDEIIGLKNLKDLLHSWKSFNTSGLRQMLKVIETKSRSIWQQQMPIGKVWKRRGSSVRVYQSNPYVTVAAESIFSPIIDTFSFLPRTEAVEILCKSVIPFVRSWMECILEQQILFSRFGSMQLDFDFLHFLKWFEQESFDFSLEELSEIQSLPVVTKMRNAILLLSCQPDRTKSREEYPPFNNGMNNALASSTSAISQVSAETINDAQFETIINDVDLREKERWLALRAKGGTSKRRFLCVS